jgi:hypothetical protein
VVAGGGGPSSLARMGLRLRQCDALDGVLPAAELGAGAAAPGFLRRGTAAAVAAWAALRPELGGPSAASDLALRARAAALEWLAGEVAALRGCAAAAVLASGSLAESWTPGAAVAVVVRDPDPD